MTAAEDDPRVEALLRDAPVRRAKPFERRELAVQAGFAGAVVAAVIAMAFAFPDRGPEASWTALLLFALAMVVQKIRFTIGAYLLTPVQLVAVPAILLLPPTAAVVVLFGAVLVIRVPDYLTGRTHPDRVLTLLADQWYVVGAGLVVAAAAPVHPEFSAWPIYVAALAAQFIVDTCSALARLWLAQGVAPGIQARSSALVLAVDSSLAPLGLLAAVAAVTTPAALLALVPLLGLLELLGRERERRIQHTLALSEAYRGSALLMGEMLEADDEYTGGEHSKGVVALALAVGQELGLDAREQRELEFGSLLHDIGKLRTPDEIINKPGKLTEEEWAIIKRHPEDGQAMLDRIGGLLAEVGLVVRHHHERWEGGGYPDGIGGEDIPLAARIITACDAYSAMTTNRSYRKALPVEVAVAELRECSGTQFDPRVVEALIAVVEREIPAQPSVALAA